MSGFACSSVIARPWALNVQVHDCNALKWKPLLSYWARGEGEHS